MESPGKLPFKSKPDFPRIDKTAGLSCLHYLIQLRLHVLNAFLTCSPLRGCWLLYGYTWWWLFARAFWSHQQRLSVQHLLDIALCLILLFAQENSSLLSFPSQLSLCLSTVLLAPFKPCQHILVLHVEKLQAYNEIWARRRAYNRWCKTLAVQVSL